MNTRFNKGRAWVEINMNNLQHNVDALKAVLPEGCELMPAVKADAYGHGAVLIASRLNELGVHAFCVAAAEEGVQLRRHGIKGVVLVLGYTHPEEFERLARYNLTQTVVDYDYARLLNNYSQPITAHIAVDTGMHRLGERCENFDKILEMFSMENLRVTGIYTHLCADDSKKKEDCEYTEKQAKAFWQIVNRIKGCGYSPKAHLLSSYGLINYPEYGGDYARIGIALYGILSTEEDNVNCKLDLRPVLSAKARITSVRGLHRGEKAGYGLAYTAEKDTNIAAISIGYADGLPRALSCGVGNVLVHGRKAPIIGRICMDQTLIDVSDIPDVKGGDVAVLIGNEDVQTITVCDVARQADTISNEILSRLGQRLERVRE